MANENTISPIGLDYELLAELTRIDSVINALPNDPQIDRNELNQIMTERQRANDTLQQYKRDLERMQERYKAAIQRHNERLNDLIDRSRQ